MRKNYFLTILMVLASFGSFAQLGTTTFNTAADNAGNYGGGWSNGDNSGTGFGTWSIASDGGGHYVGGTGQAATSFGLYSDGSGKYSFAERSLTSDLKMGEKISVNLGHTTTINEEVFLQLLDDGVAVFTLKYVNGASQWQINDGGSDFNSGQTYLANSSIAFTFSYNEDGTYSYTFGSGSGSNYTAANTITGINSIKFQSTNQGGGANFGFNDLSIDSKYTINNNSTLASDADITVPYLDVQTGSTLNVGTTSGLLVSGDLNVSGSLNIASGSSLRVNGSSTGNVTYNRNLSTTNWYLVSSPVVGQTIADFYSNETPALGTGTGNAQNVAIATYDNSQVSASDRFSYYTEGQVDGLDGDDTTDTFSAGIGYSVQLQSSQNISFTGTVRTDNAGVPVTLAMGNNNYNLIGNPYLASINSTTFLSAESANVESTFWMWNGTSYDTRTTGTHANFKIAPGQAFFVEAKTTNTVTFTEANQSHETDNFQKSTSSKTKVTINIADGTQTRKAELFYIDGTTTGLDNGFDGKMFNGVEQNFAIFSHLITNNTGTKYAIQSLPNSNLESMVVPVGIIANAGQITFSAQALNLPTDIKVFLEDRNTNTFTRIDGDNEYKITLKEAVNGIGRFYVHTSASNVLNTENISLENVNVYKKNNSTLQIVGLKQGNTSIKLFNILGKQVLNTNFKTNGVSEISLPKLSSGIYMVQIENKIGKLSKKIIIE